MRDYLNLRTLRAGVTVVLASIVPFLSSSPISEELWRPTIPLGLDLYLPVPEDNSLTREKVELGRKLFFDPLLSRDETLSCAGCHDPERAFTDGRAISEGVFGRKGTRSVPMLVNRGYGRAFFWDGRISSLEEQVLQPIQDPKEMEMTLPEVLRRLRQNRQYRQRFQSLFGREVTAEDLARVLASYVRTILSGNSALDRYVSGQREALSKRAQEGLRLFRGKANCTACHIGPNFTDERFHNTGVAWKKGQLTDPGRFLVTGQEEDQGAFKTPTLREIARTAPYRSSAPRHLGPRDRFIGWSGQQRRQNIRFLAYNSRFLIFPWIHVPHLASHILGAMARMLSRDWEHLYGHPVYFLETFIDPERFKGTC